MAAELELLPLGPVTNLDTRVLIIGNGLVGKRLAKDFGEAAIVVDYPQVDVTHQYQVEDLVLAHPEAGIVVNAAGYTLVDKAQTEPRQAHLINVVGNRNVAMACEAAGRYAVFLSSETVFGNGQPGREFDESEIPPVFMSPRIRGVYGTSKAMGEFEAWSYFVQGGRGIIGRLSYPSDRESGYFPKVLKFPGLNDDCEIVTTLTPEIAPAIAQAYRLKVTGKVLHLVGTKTSPFEFGNEARRRMGVSPAPPIKVIPNPDRAPRPQYGLLSREKTHELLDFRLRTTSEQLDYLTS